MRKTTRCLLRLRAEALLNRPEATLGWRDVRVGNRQRGLCRTQRHAARDGAGAGYDRTLRRWRANIQTRWEMTVEDEDEEGALTERKPN